jgi:hypothetical protein
VVDFMMRQDFYLYTYSYPNGTPFYVGKGCGRRLKVHLCDAKAGRNKDKWAVRVVAKLLRKGEQPLIKKIATGLDNELACFAEEEFIAKYGRKDLKTGILVNCTSGGDGGTDLRPEAKQKQINGLLRGGIKTRFAKGSVPFNKGVPAPSHVVEAARQANLGKKHSEETKAKRSAKLRNYKHKILTCPQCGKSGGETALKRWHFDKCTGTNEFRARATVDGRRVHLGRFSTQEEADNATIAFYNSVNKPVPKEFWAKRA